MLSVLERERPVVEILSILLFWLLHLSPITVIPAPLCPNVCRDYILFSIQVRIPGLGQTSITLQLILSLAHDKQRKDLYLEFAREITRYKIGRVRLAG